MSAREWNPGDVARERDRNGNDGLLFRTESGWVDAEGDRRLVLTDTRVSRNARPLVVIDPENREQVERLLVAQVGTTSGCPDVVMISEAQVSRMQAALRSLIEPPRPEEPTGLGAVVEDDESVHWVRRSTHPARSWSADTGSFQKSADWSDIAAVRVLSEGVTP